MDEDRTCEALLPSAEDETTMECGDPATAVVLDLPLCDFHRDRMLEWRT